MNSPSALDALRTAAVPRPRAVTRPLQRRLVPLIQIILYGVMASLLIPVAAGMVYGALTNLVPTWSPPMLAKQTYMVGCLLLGAWLFVRWVRTKDGNVRKLLEQGTLLEGVVDGQSVVTYKGMRLTTEQVRFDIGGKTHRVALQYPEELASSPRTVATILYAPEATHSAGFAPDGRLIYALPAK